MAARYCFSLFSFWTILSAICSLTYSNNNIPSIDDSVAFSVRWKEPLIDVNEFATKNQDSLQMLPMMTSEKEPYVCFVPKAHDSREEQEQSIAYTGPTPIELLEALFKKPFCTYRLEQYWTYELCHGKSLRQYHEESVVSKVSVQEYFLGRYDEAKKLRDDVIYKQNRLANEGKKPKMGTIRLDSMEMPYFELNMTDGTMCDINGKPRMARIHYVCSEDSKHDILSLEEKSTCEYRVVVLTPVLCSHPDYRYEMAPERPINCHPVRSDRKSASEVENTKSKPEVVDDADINGKVGDADAKKVDVDGDAENAKNDADSVTIEEEEFPVKPYRLEELEHEDREFRNAANDPLNTFKKFLLQELKLQAVLNEQARQQVAQQQRDAGIDRHRDGESKTFSTAGAVPHDPRLVEEFLSGKHCLTGGMGWWKYEFCYGRKVEQFHEERAQSRINILLGVWNEKKHRQWMDQHPERKVPKGKVPRLITHYYTDGDVCDKTGEARSVEVKLKCKDAEGHPDAVTLYLLEPKPCSYVLGVDSPIVCSLLENVDEYGIPQKPSQPSLE